MSHNRQTCEKRASCYSNTNNVGKPRSVRHACYLLSFTPHVASHMHTTEIRVNYIKVFTVNNGDTIIEWSSTSTQSVDCIERSYKSTSFHFCLSTGWVVSFLTDYSFCFWLGCAFSSSQVPDPHHFSPWMFNCGPHVCEFIHELTKLYNPCIFRCLNHYGRSHSQINGDVLMTEPG